MISHLPFAWMVLRTHCWLCPVDLQAPEFSVVNSEHTLKPRVCSSLLAVGWTLLAGTVHSLVCAFLCAPGHVSVPLNFLGSLPDRTFHFSVHSLSVQVSSLASPSVVFSTTPSCPLASLCAVQAFASLLACFHLAPR